jgi:Family of unknown function (DUF6312)
MKESYSMTNKVLLKTEGTDTPVERPSFDKSVVRVVRLQSTSDGNAMPVVLYKSARKGRRISSEYRGVHKRFVRLMDGHDAFIHEYRKRHEDSNSKKKDGWMKDFRKNVSKAFRVGRKRAKVSFGFS